MAMSAPRSSLFTFESTVHSFHVLRCLDEQRRRDVLCDVTVVVEGQSFRAHRSVLASCSEYFTHRTSSITQHGAVITLPSEVTVDGFQPLLNFAYTSKLHFGKENVLEIRNAASILGFRDLDEACYDFLLPKFLSTSKSSTPFQRKTCCKKKYKSQLPKEDCDTDSDDVLLDEKEVKPVADSSSQQEVAWDCNKSVNNKMGSHSSADTIAAVVEGTNDHFMQCPKYRKFQLAFEKETCVTEKSLINPSCLLCLPSNTDSMNETEVQFPGNPASNVYKGGVDGSGKTEIHDMTREHRIGRREDEMVMKSSDKREGNLDEKDRENNIMKMEEKMELSNTISSSGTFGTRVVSSEPATVLSERSPGLILNHCPLVAFNEGPAITRPVGQERFVMDFNKDQKASDPGVLEPVSIHQNIEGQVEGERKRADKTYQTGSNDSLSENNTREGSMIETEVTKNLAEQLRPDECSSQLNFQDPQAESSEDTVGGCVKNMSLDWQKLHTNFSTTRTSCPFFQDLNQQKCLWKEAGLSECEGASQSGVSSLNSGDDGDSETETEGDSESYTRERARQVKLPFSVEWIVDLSRNDFQQLLKQQVLTREQLEFVHDMRRRSKNRLAAQRCRKRKLDCIYNLQCEISKLKTEREKLIMEKSQLSQLKLTTCHNVSALCQKVCNEANLQPEQLQVLAKYTSPDCPLSSFFPHIDTLLSKHGLPHELASEETPSSSSRDTIMGQQSL